MSNENKNSNIASMEITPYKNGIHSLAEGLRNLKDYENSNNNPYLLKEVIIKTHHGLETLFKDILFKYNPVFILVEKTTIEKIVGFYQSFENKSNNYLFEEEATISAIDALKRLRTLKIGELGEQDYSQLLTSYQSLNGVRNQIQHFAIKGNPEEIIRILGNLIPRAIKYISSCYKHLLVNDAPSRIKSPSTIAGIDSFLIKIQNLNEDLTEVFDLAVDTIEHLESRYDTLLKSAISKFKKLSIKSLTQSIKIKDSGMIGAEPYLPSFNLKGWMNEHLQPHVNFSGLPIEYSSAHSNAIYHSTINISLPEVIHTPPLSNFGDCTTKINIDLECVISILNSNTFFKITEIGDHLEFIRSPEIRIFISLTVTSRSSLTEHHFNIQSIEEISGDLELEFKSSMYGDSKNAPAISGAQKLKLTKKNTSIRFHAFMNSNKTFLGSHSLDIQIDEVGDLNFK